MKTLVFATVLFMLTTPLAAQWIDHPTPGIPRTADGKPNLTAPAPQTTDGKPDLSGIWQRISLKYERNVAADLKPGEIQPWAQALVGQRAEDLQKDHMSVQCLPWGPSYSNSARKAKIVQTPGLILMLDEDLTYRQIFMDGRALETDPMRSWMGYSVGRWEGNTLVVDSFGFNDRTWLNNRGLPHSEALRMTERYQRRDFGHLRIDVTFADPSAYTKPLSFVVNMNLAADTEMIEAVCETGTEHWVGGASDLQTSTVTVAPDVLARYVGVYSGVWAGRPRTVDVTLSAEGLAVMIDGRTGPLPLLARSETLFESSGGLGYEFISDGSGPATHVVEIHVSGNYRYARR